MLLAVVTVLSGSVNCFAVAIDTEVPAGNKQTVTVGELVADAYSAKLTAAEQAVLKSGYLTGGSITYTAPSEGDYLIAVDEAAKTITIKSATKDRIHMGAGRCAYRAGGRFRYRNGGADKGKLRLYGVFQLCR